ncbi:MAG: transposase [Segetibacter sp.]
MRPNQQNIMEEAPQRVKKSPIRRTRNQIIKLLKEYESKEGMRVVEFCKLHDINKSNFYNWQKSYGGKQSVKHKPKGFLTVELTPSAEAPVNTPILFAEVKGIRLYHVVSAEYLKALVS